MSCRLPTHIDPLRLVAQRGRIEGDIALSAMKRLADSVESLDGDAHIALDFDLDEGGFKTMSGSIGARLTMRCQRCMGILVVPVLAEVRVGFVTDSAQAQELPADLEPMIAGEEPISLADLVEDELILCLPIVPVHASGEKCIDLEAFRARDEAVEKPNPFAALAVLKEKL